MRTGNTIRARVIGVAALASVLLALGTGGGCQNRVADERDKLWQQNREQQAVIDELKNRPPTERVIVQQVPATQPAPAPTPTPTPAPGPAVTTTPPAAPTEIGGFEVEDNPGAGTLTVNLPGDVVFDSGQATLKPAARASLDKVAAALKGDYAGKQVRVEGHTDADPIRRSKWKSNQELSEARAKSVRDYLVSKGIENDRLSTQGFGPDRPKSTTNKALNRRVEIVVVTNAAAAGGGGGAGNLNK